MNFLKSIDSILAVVTLTASVFALLVALTSGHLVLGVAGFVGVMAAVGMISDPL